jgi:hypothetical protein
MGALLVVMVAGSLIALPATTVALILGRRRGDDRLGKIGRNTLLAALVLLPVAFFVLVGTLFRGVCFSF